MRARGSNHHQHQHQQHRDNTRKDPEGLAAAAAAAPSISISAATSNSYSYSTSNNSSHMAAATEISATATATATKPRKFALPGTARHNHKKQPLAFRPALRRAGASSSAGGSGIGNNNGNGNSRASSQSLAPLVMAVILWYSLGVVSISSSKVLLTPYNGSGIDDEYLDDAYETYALYMHPGGLPPLFLTVQQLLLGSTFLRLAISTKFLGLTEGLVPLDALLESIRHTAGSSKGNINQNQNQNLVPRYLLNTGIFFALGFLTTNMAFGAASPTYVETLKAAEPITSAVFAVLWGIEILTIWEVVGLVGIVGGVLLSTTGSNHSASMAEGAGSSLVVATTIVMASNLCFSLRGLYQKLFRKGAAAVSSAVEDAVAAAAIEHGDVQPSKSHHKPLDDLNLQFRMQQTGVAILVIPTLLLHGPGMVRHAFGAAAHLSTQDFLRLVQNYAVWSIGNGLAFSSYNLASTYLLTRISVVHHAALNCTRRIVAIVCTGFLFRIPVTFQSAVGIVISFVGFMVFTKAKSTKNQQYHHGSSRHRSKRRGKGGIKIPGGDGETAIPPEAASAIVPQETGVVIPIPSSSNSSSVSGGSLHDFGTRSRAKASASTIASASTAASPLISTSATATTSRFPVPPPPGNRGTSAMTTRTTAARFPPPPPPPPPPPMGR